MNKFLKEAVMLFKGGESKFVQIDQFDLRLHGVMVDVGLFRWMCVRKQLHLNINDRLESCIMFLIDNKLEICNWYLIYQQISYNTYY